MTEPYPTTLSASKSAQLTFSVSQTHDHTIPGVNLPFGVFLVDQTSQGTLWDPTLNAYTYSYDNAADSFTAYDGSSPTSWLLFQGIWGDEQLPASDPRQHEDLGISATAEWTGGPTGPNDKNLGRDDICEKDPCTVNQILIAKK